MDRSSRREEGLTGVALAPGESPAPVVSATPAIRVVIAHHWALLREGLLDFLSEYDDVQVAAEACDGREALAAAEAIRPEVLLVDLALATGTDSLIANIRRISPRTKVLLLGAEPGDEALQHALRQGARGYLAKSTGMGAMLKAIRAVHAGEAWIERAVMGRLLDGLAATADARRAAPAHPISGDGVLSKRERHVADLVATGLRNKEIAASRHQRKDRQGPPGQRLPQAAASTPPSTRGSEPRRNCAVYAPAVEHRAPTPGHERLWDPGGSGTLVEHASTSMRDRPQPAAFKPREIGVVVAHDHALFRESLARLVRTEPDIKVVGEVSEACELAGAVAALQPDVLLLKPSVAGPDVVQTLRLILDNSPTAKVLLLVSRLEPEFIFRVLQAGAKGYVVKASRMDQFVNAIRSVHDGKAWGDVSAAAGSEGGSRVNPEVTSRRRPTTLLLTRRERQIATLVAQGLSNKQIYVSG